MYADTVTGSMKRAIDETERRREIQTAYNEEHGIIPKTIRKDVHDVIKTYETAKTMPSPKIGAEDDAESKVKRLTELMNEASANLDFETAAIYRDEIIKLKGKN